MTRATSRRGLEGSDDLGAGLAPAHDVDAVSSQIRDRKMRAIQPRHLVSMGTFLTICHRSRENTALTEIEDASDGWSGGI